MSNSTLSLLSVLPANSTAVQKKKKIVLNVFNVHTKWPKDMIAMLRFLFLNTIESFIFFLFYFKKYFSLRITNFSNHTVHHSIKTNESYQLYQLYVTLKVVYHWIPNLTIKYRFICSFHVYLTENFVISNN